MVKVEEELTALMQKRRTPWLDRYFKFSSLLGEELFYILVLPLSSWVIASQLAVHLTMLLAMSVGIGNILKNFFLIPRPPHPPVWVHANHETDHGLPSTHTMTAVTIPWYLLIYIGYLEPSVALPSYLIALMTWWSVSVAASRLYNGHHTPMDVLVGAALSILFLDVWTKQLRPWVDSFIVNDSVPGVFIVAGIAVSMLVFHPIPPKIPTPAYAETGLVTGTATGSFLALWFRHSHPVRSTYLAYHSFFGLPSAYPYVAPLLAEHFYVICALRFLVGVVIVLVTRLVVKTLGVMLVVRLARLLNKRDYSSKAAFKYSDADAAVKLLTYSGVGFAAVYVSHCAFAFLGLHLPLDDASLTQL